MSTRLELEGKKKKHNSTLIIPHIHKIQSYISTSHQTQLHLFLQKINFFRSVQMNQKAKSSHCIISTKFYYVVVLFTLMLIHAWHIFSIQIYLQWCRQTCKSIRIFSHHCSPLHNIYYFMTMMENILHPFPQPAQCTRIVKYTFQQKIQSITKERFLKRGHCKVSRFLASKNEFKYHITTVYPF